MKLINRFNAGAFPMETVSPYTEFQGELQVNGKEQALRWEITAQVIDAILIGTPKVEVLKASDKAKELLGDCLLIVKIGGEPAYGPVPLLSDHSRLTSSEGQIHCWFEEDPESPDVTKRGIFVINAEIIEAVVLAPWVIETGHVLPKIRITIDASLCRQIRTNPLAP